MTGHRAPPLAPRWVMGQTDPSSDPTERWHQVMRQMEPTGRWQQVTRQRDPSGDPTVAHGAERSHRKVAAADRGEGPPS